MLITAVPSEGALRFVLALGCSADDPPEPYSQTRVAKPASPASAVGASTQQQSATTMLRAPRGGPLLRRATPAGPPIAPRCLP